MLKVLKREKAKVVLTSDGFAGPAQQVLSSQLCAGQSSHGSARFSEFGRFLHLKGLKSSKSESQCFPPVMETYRLKQSQSH